MVRKQTTQKDIHNRGKVDIDVNLDHAGKAATSS